MKSFHFQKIPITCTYQGLHTVLGDYWYPEKPVVSRLEAFVPKGEKQNDGKVLERKGGRDWDPRQG